MTNDKPCADCGQERGQGGARGLCKSCYYKRRRRGTLAERAKLRHSYEEYLTRIVPDENGCWLWPGFVNKGGYGMHSTHGLAHVRAYEDRYGPVPPKHDVGHACHDADSSCQDWRTCQHRRCVNPDHLVAQTRSENLRARPWVKTHCIRGHELRPDNVYVIKSTGSRQCKPCARIVRAERAARQQAVRRLSAIPVPRVSSESEVPCLSTPRSGK